jgi:hypothetical protein
MHSWYLKSADGAKEHEKKRLVKWREFHDAVENLENWGLLYQEAGCHSKELCEARQKYLLKKVEAADHRNSATQERIYLEDHPVTPREKYDILKSIAREELDALVADGEAGAAMVSTTGRAK